jgi:hypothetical protein
MKKLAVLIVVALAGLLLSCADNTRNNNITTTTNGNWEAGFSGGTGPTSLLGFVVQFSVTDTTGHANEPLDIYNFAFYNAGECFATGKDEETESGTATLTTASSGQVTGTLTLVITSKATGAALTLNGNLQGMSNGTTTSTGTLSNGVVWGNWTLTPGNGTGPAAACTTPTDATSATFVMCQGESTCTVP